jgi:hypothetical protein
MPLGRLGSLLRRGAAFALAGLLPFAVAGEVVVRAYGFD